MLRCIDAKRLRLNNLKAKTAFTLAEVLITLGIIGVVAAITLPTLITKIQDRQNIAKWKTVYSQVNNAFNATYSEFPETFATGVENFWNDEFISKFAERFEIQDKCGRITSYNPCNNYLDYKQNYFSISNLNNYTSYKTLAGEGMNSYDFYRAAFLLKNGAAIYFGGSHSGPTILVDVNNFTVGPNMLGRDLFGIHCAPNRNCSKLIPMGALDTTNENTVYNYNGKVVGACSKDIGLAFSNYLYQAAGAGCAAKYLME